MQKSFAELSSRFTDRMSGDTNLIFEKEDHIETCPAASPSQKKGSGRLSLMSGIYAHQFNVVGNTVFSDEELAEVIVSYEKREISPEELQAVREALTRFYIHRGYITSGVIIPDQDVVDGLIILRVIEGRLANIEVEGNRYLHAGYISDRLEIAGGPPLNVMELQQALQYLLQDHRIKRINAHLSPGILLGESILKVHVEEESPYLLEFGISNSQSPSVGSVRTEIRGAHQNLTGRGDALEGTAGVTKGSNDVQISYVLPLTAHDTTLKTEYRESDNLIIEEPFEGLDIKSEERTFGVGISHPFYRRMGEELSLSLAIEFRRSQTFLLGRPFSFSEGSEEGKSHLKVLRFAQLWTDRSLKQIIVVRSCFSLGLDSIGTSLNSSNADERFLSWLGQIHLRIRVGETDSVVVFRSNVQLSNDPLLPLERFAIGGMHTVRGYRENRLVRDNGMTASLELQVPILEDHGDESVLQGIIFLDFGKSWNSDTHTPDPKSLPGAGFGIKLAMIRHLQLQVYYGMALRSIHTSGHDLQDHGVHFELSGHF